ncbi:MULTISPECIES: hypothetical protein [Streptomyces]|uniref:Uncharacterized protein n=1 Tax=Streptomyces lonegramiae TaxID=3075524 RepID=A0ABU2XGV5_9ACTN|nr:hypothetical protein [Streptomyces sp. DSM 41529]MDT0545067.1 hypothetical protein [Streptomyces sp. DSM 41529]
MTVHPGTVVEDDHGLRDVYQARGAGGDLCLDAAARGARFVVSLPAS